ncbi:MAG: hypothetical protein ACYSUK_08880 [Planctomycetota bacterium]
MSLKKTIPAMVLGCILFVGCNTSSDTEQTSSESVPNVVTKDIQDGIRD